MASSCCCGKLRQLGSKLGGRCAATLEQRGKLGSPTQRSLKLMRERGFYAEVVEHWNQWARKRKDLFGFIDVLCLGDTGDLVGVQSTSASNISARVRKITDSPFLGRVRKAGIRILVHGWKKVKGRWQVREVDIS